MGGLNAPLIGLDASRAARSLVTGTEAYSRQLIAALLDRPSDLRYRLYANRLLTDVVPASARAESHVVSTPYLWTHLGLRTELARRPPDLLYVPSHVVPIRCPVRSVVTVHDVGYLWHRSAYAPLAWLLLHLGTRHNARTAHRIIADSQATARDLIAHFGVAPERLRVAYLGGPPVEEVVADQSVSERYGLPARYFLFVGTLQSRKNLDRTLRAFARVARRDAGVALALAGAAGRAAQQVARRVQDLRLGDRVRLLGYVPAVDLPGLYAGAVGFVFPSLYEGFGLPALEAMAWGTPVIASTTSSLPEVVGSAGILADPYDVAGLAAAMERLLDDHALRTRLITAGRERARSFTWERCAEQVEDVLRESLSRG